MCDVEFEIKTSCDRNVLPYSKRGKRWQPDYENHRWLVGKWSKTTTEECDRHPPVLVPQVWHKFLVAFAERRLLVRPHHAATFKKELCQGWAAVERGINISYVGTKLNIWPLTDSTDVFLLPNSWKCGGWFTKNMRTILNPSKADIIQRSTR